MNDDLLRPAPRRRWDAIRHVTVWFALVEVLVVVALVVGVWTQSRGSGPGEAATAAAALGLMAPAVLAGLVSGGRFASLYAGYAERLDPTAPLSADDTAAGARTTSGMLGDGLWGSLVAGIAVAVTASLAVTALLGFGVILAAPIIAVVGALGWFTGWAIGAVAAMLIGAAVGILVGVGRRPERARRLPWILIATFLPVLLVAVALPGAGTRVNGAVNVGAAILYAAGFPVAGAEFLLGGALFVVARVAVWAALVLAAALVAIGAPALLRRSGRG